MALVTLNVANLVKYKWATAGRVLESTGYKLSKNDSYLVIFSIEQEALYHAFMKEYEDKIEIIHTEVACNLVHPGKNRLYVIFFNKKEEPCAVPAVTEI